MKMPAILACAAMFAGAAQAADTVESLANIGEAETAVFDAQSVQSRNEGTRFDVRVTWRDADKRPPGAAASRVIRYLARCDKKTITVAAVATLDANGKMLKSYVLPPGGSDFSVPAEASREAGWLAAACRGG